MGFLALGNVVKNKPNRSYIFMGIKVLQWIQTSHKQATSIKMNIDSQEL
jgi:hypothetical protein